MYNIENFIIGLRKIFPERFVEEGDHSILIKQLSSTRFADNSDTEEKILCELVKNDLNDVVNSLNCKKFESFSLVGKNIMKKQYVRKILHVFHQLGLTMKNNSFLFF